MQQYCQHAQLLAACARLSAAQAPQLPLFAAAAEGRIAIVHFSHAGNRWKPNQIERIRRPVVALVGNDPEPSTSTSLHPEGWEIATRLRYWCRAAIIHGTGGLHDHYRLAVDAAEAHGRVALVETDSVTAVAWGQFLGCPRTMLFVPAAGGVHPSSPARKAMQ